MDTSSRSTDITLRMKCPTCASTLSLLAGRSQLTFHCKRGHTYPMRMLFQAQQQDVHRGLHAVLEVWEEKVVILRRVAERARSDDRQELAETFAREVRQMEVRIQSLRDHLQSVSGESGSGSSVAG